MSVEQGSQQSGAGLSDQPKLQDWLRRIDQMEAPPSPDQQRQIERLRDFAKFAADFEAMPKDSAATWIEFFERLKAFVESSDHADTPESAHLLEMIDQLLTRMDPVKFKRLLMKKLAEFVPSEKSRPVFLLKLRDLWSQQSETERGQFCIHSIVSSDRGRIRSYFARARANRERARKLHSCVRP